MKTWVAILSVVVIVQGVLLARSLKRIERLNEAIFVHSKKETVFIPEMRALKLTVSRVVLETRKGKPVGELSAGGDGKSGPRFALSHSHEETHSSLQGELNTDRAHVMMVQQASGDGTRDGPFSRLTFTMREGRIGLKAEPAYSDGTRRLSIGCGHARGGPAELPYGFWGYTLPGLPRFSYPRELSVVRKELAKLTPQTDEGEQRRIMREISIQHGLGEVFPEMAKLCEAYPAESDFPRGFVQCAKGVEECQALAIGSLDRKPSSTMVELLAQMIVEGGERAGGIDLRDYFSALAHRPDLPSAVRRNAEGWDKAIRDRHPRKDAAKLNSDPGN